MPNKVWMNWETGKRRSYAPSETLKRRGYENPTPLHFSCDASISILCCTRAKCRLCRYANACRKLHAHICPSRSSNSRMYFTNVFLWVWISLVRAKWELTIAGSPFRHISRLVWHRRISIQAWQSTRRPDPLVIGYPVQVAPGHKLVAIQIMVTETLTGSIYD